MVQQLEQTGVVSPLIYPESDGKPLADNTIQFGLIMKIKGGLDVLFADDPDVFVAGDLLWYPVEGSLTCQAPDVMVALGRPKGDRGSYKQWQEGNIPPQVAFEILSPNNTRKEMALKFEFYQRHGVEEYYLYDPAKNILQGWLKTGNHLIAVAEMEGWVSPRLEVQFGTKTGMLELYSPTGKRFETFVETVKWAQQVKRQAQQESQRANQESQRADQESQRADQESQRADQESQRADQESQRADQESQARYEAIGRLLDLGLTQEEVAEALGFPIEEINETV
jgi:Uma2 family endonuclease